MIDAVRFDDDLHDAYGNKTVSYNYSLI